MKEFTPAPDSTSIVSVTDRVKPVALGMGVTSAHFLGDRAAFVGGEWIGGIVDAVIDVEETARRALGLGRRTAVFRYPGAIHDVFLSRPAVRREAYADLLLWLSLYPG